MTKDIIKKYRKQAGLTQTELAEELGVKQSAIAKCESGENKLSDKMRESYVSYFGADLDRDLFWDEISELGQKYADSATPRTTIQLPDFLRADSDNTDAPFQGFLKTPETLALDSTVKYLCEFLNYQLEVIGSFGVSDYYHISKDSFDCVIPFTDMLSLWEKMIRHMSIDFESFIKERSSNGNDEKEGQKR